MTAYFGLFEIGRPEPGQTVVVSAAAGSVGSLVGQMAKVKGCRVVGIAGGSEKCRLLTEEYGFDAAVDYKGEQSVAAALREHCPDGIDVFFDNVGGEILEAALRNLARGARVVLCGAISQYNEGAQQGPRNYMALLIKRARMEGFVVFDYARRYAEAAQEIAGWISSGQLTTREHIVDGLETFPESLLMLYRGENTGKLMLRVSEGSCGRQPAVARASAINSPRARRWRPSGSKFASASQASKPARTGGHSWSTSAYQAVSRLWPLITRCWRKIPSKRRPNRSAARREAAFRALHFHSRRR